MAAAAEDALGERVADGVVAVKDGHLAPTRRVRLLEAGHPVPDERGAAAARAIHDLVARAEADDLVLVLISGGGSALTPAPAPPITLAEKQVLTRLLLRAGATINRAQRGAKALLAAQGRPACPRRRSRARRTPCCSPTSSAIRSTSSPRGRPRPTSRPSPKRSPFSTASASRDQVAPSIRQRLERGPARRDPGDAQAGRSALHAGHEHGDRQQRTSWSTPPWQRARALGLTPHAAHADPGGRGQGRRWPIRGHGARRPRGHRPPARLRAASSRAGRPR